MQTLHASCNPCTHKNQLIDKKLVWRNLQLLKRDLNHLLFSFNSRLGHLSPCKSNMANGVKDYGSWGPRTSRGPQVHHPCFNSSIVFWGIGTVSTSSSSHTVLQWKKPHLLQLCLLYKVKHLFEEGFHNPFIFHPGAQEEKILFLFSHLEIHGIPV